MRCAGLQGVHRRRLRGCTRRDRPRRPRRDLVDRTFRPAGPDRLYVADITQHRTSEGWVYLAVVLDCFSRRVVGWAMADHIRSELVVDALQMAIWNRRPAPGAIHHSDHGSPYTSWAFGQRLREAGLLGSMGSIGDCFDNSVAESFFATLQTELLDRSTWPTRERPRPGRLRVHRRLLQPAPAALHPRLPQPRRLRAAAQGWTPHRDRRMMPVTTPAPSGQTGPLQRVAGAAVLLRDVELAELVFELVCGRLCRREPDGEHQPVVGQRGGREAVLATVSRKVASTIGPVTRACAVTVRA